MAVGNGMRVRVCVCVCGGLSYFRMTVGVDDVF